MEKNSYRTASQINIQIATKKEKPSNKYAVFRTMKLPRDTEPIFICRSRKQTEKLPNLAEPSRQLPH